MAPPRLSLPPTRCPSVQIQKRLPARRRQADRDRLPPSLPPSRRRSVCVCAWWLAHRRAPCRRRRSRRAISALRAATARHGGTAAAALRRRLLRLGKLLLGRHRLQRAQPLEQRGVVVMACGARPDMICSREREGSGVRQPYMPDQARGGDTRAGTLCEGPLSLCAPSVSLCALLSLSLRVVGTDMLASTAHTHGVGESAATHTSRPANPG